MTVGAGMPEGEGEIAETGTGGRLVAPPHTLRFIERVLKLAPGHYILTLTINEQRGLFWTVQRMNQVER